MNRHVTEEELQSLQCGELTDAARLELAEHLGACGICAERLTALWAEGGPEPPAGMRAEIMAKIHRNRRELMLYSLRVGLAACAALVVMAISSMDYRPVDIKAPSMHFTHEINNRLNQFSYQLLNGGTLYEKEK